MNNVIASHPPNHTRARDLAARAALSSKPRSNVRFVCLTTAEKNFRREQENDATKLVKQKDWDRALYLEKAGRFERSGRRTVCK